MAAGDRNIKDKPNDIVQHFGRFTGVLPALCNQKGAGYITPDINQVTCIKCINKLKNK